MVDLAKLNNNLATYVTISQRRDLLFTTTSVASRLLLITCKAKKNACSSLLTCRGKNPHDDASPSNNLTVSVVLHDFEIGSRR